MVEWEKQTVADIGFDLSCASDRPNRPFNESAARPFVDVEAAVHVG
jgi:hypothetical protein